MTKKEIEEETKLKMDQVNSDYNAGKITSIEAISKLDDLLYVCGYKIGYLEGYSDGVDDIIMMGNGQEPSGTLEHNENQS